jgi:lipooligosaccharide transport system permease protein
MTIQLPSIRRARRMVQRNLIVYKHTWMIIFSGFFEPLFYLIGIGLGIGGMIGSVNGIPYSAFVAPGLLASSCVNGAITDGFFNIFFKLKFQKTYDGILATPMRVPDIALGEMLWAQIRGSIYAALFIVVLFIMGKATRKPLILSRWGILALPAAMLCSAAFSSMAICMSSFVRKIQDFDAVMGLIVMPMFLFSGIFFPVTLFPAAFQRIVQIVPLYHAVAVLRQLTTGDVRFTILAHIAYLVFLGAFAFVVAMRRLERALIK